MFSDTSFAVGVLTQQRRYVEALRMDTRYPLRVCVRVMRRIRVGRKTFSSLIPYEKFVHPFGSRGGGRRGDPRVAQKGNGIVLFLHVPSAKQRNRRKKKKPRFYLFIKRGRKRSHIALIASQSADF